MTGVSEPAPARASPLAPGGGEPRTGGSRGRVRAWSPARNRLGRRATAPGRAAPGVAPFRPRQREVRPRPGDPDVEQPPLLLERRLVVERLADRQRALLEHRQEDRVPLEALRPVVGRQLDAAAGAAPVPPARRMPDSRTPPAVLRASGPASPPRGRRGSGREERGRALAGLVAALVRGVLEPEVAGPARADGRGQLRARRGRGRLGPPDVVDRPAHVRPTEERDAADPKGDAGPVSAASIGSSWALVRVSTAISDGAVPPAISVAICLDSQVSSASSVACRSIVGAGPPGRVARRCLRSPGAPQQPVREAEDLRRRAVVLRQLDDARSVMAVGERLEERRRRASERVDRLVGVADDAHVGRRARPQLQEPLLERVRVLVLVDAEPALPGPDRRSGLRIAFEEVDRLGQQVVEVDPAGPTLARS